MANVGERWREEERGVGARLIPEEFALHSERLGGATRLAVRGILEAVLMKGGRWSSDSFTVYVRADLEDPIWVSEVMEHGAQEFER